MAEKSSLEDCVAIVMGASRGIGREIVLHLARKGEKLVINYARNPKKAEEVASTINKDRDAMRVVTCKADVSKDFEVSKLFDVAEEAFGTIHILVNCVGILNPKYPPLVDTSEEAWDSTFNANCKGAFLYSREAANRVIKTGGGYIINFTTSLVGSLRVGYGAYTASKAAMETITKILVRDLRGTKITANCVASGAVATDMFFARKNDALVEHIAKDVPLERLGEVSDIAPVVAFLDSDEGEWVNAQVVRVNGGAP